MDSGIETEGKGQSRTDSISPERRPCVWAHCGESRGARIVKEPVPAASTSPAVLPTSASNSTRAKRGLSSFRGNGYGIFGRLFLLGQCKLSSTAWLFEHRWQQAEPQLQSSNAMDESIQSNEDCSANDIINNALPDEVLLLILEKLPGSEDRACFSAVCKRWMGLEAALHERVRVSGGPRLAHRLSKLVQRFTSTKDLVVEEKHLPRRAFFRKGAASTESLTNALKVVAAEYKGLRSLSLSCCPNLRDAALDQLFQGCGGVKALRLSHCDNVATSKSRPFTRISKGAKGGCSLTLGSDVSDGNRALMENLQELDLPNCKGVCGEGLRQLLERTGVGAHLEQMNLYGTSMDDAGLRVLGDLCPSLERLSLAGCTQITDFGMTALTAGCPRLRDLNMSRCPLLTDASLRALATSCGPALHFLTMGAQPEISNAGLVALSTSCPHLKLLSVTDCHRVSEPGISALAQGCSQLQVLKLGACLSVRDAALRALARHARNLVILELRESGVTDRGLEALADPASVCQKLDRLVLAGCPHVGDSGLLRLASSGLPLRRVDIRRCRGVTTRGLAKFMTECKALIQVDVDRARTEALDTLLGIEHLRGAIVS